MKLWKPLAVLLPAFALLSCGGSQVLDIRPLHIREIGASDEGDDPMIHGEYQRRMHGAIGIREQGQRLGYYYTILWNDDSGGTPGEIVFEYQQGLTGSRVKKMVHAIPAGEAKGRAEFSITGDSYQKGGKVLAWRCKLYREGREVASRQSYLWQ
ncbi:hypothetical protein [Luteolibacter sp. Populi]|uniref:hypothetical protein n=1 Tax=Luteolibacter sp. Populi TaxID=3230487 RepID=UPI0034678B2D